MNYLRLNPILSLFLFVMLAAAGCKSTKNLKNEPQKKGQGGRISYEEAIKGLSQHLQEIDLPAVIGYSEVGGVLAISDVDPKDVEKYLGENLLWDLDPEDYSYRTLGYVEAPDGRKRIVVLRIYNSGNKDERIVDYLMYAYNDENQRFVSTIISYEYEVECGLTTWSRATIQKDASVSVEHYERYTNCETDSLVEGPDTQIRTSSIRYSKGEWRELTEK